MWIFTTFATLVAIVTVNGQSDITQHVPTTVEANPSVASLLRSVEVATSLTACSGVILNNVAVLSAARCFQGDGAERWSIRVGSTFWNTGGIVYAVSEIVPHPNWNEFTMQADLAVVRVAGFIFFSNVVQPGGLSGPNYVVPTNDAIRTIGWGYNSVPFWRPQMYENLRQLQLANLNLEVCRRHYTPRGYSLRPNQLCSGFINPDEDALARDTCLGDPGAPVYHNNAVVGIRSFGVACLNRRDVPSVDTRISAYVFWIVETVEQTSAK